MSTTVPANYTLARKPDLAAATKSLSAPATAARPAQTLPFTGELSSASTYRPPQGNPFGSGEARAVMQRTAGPAAAAPAGRLQIAPEFAGYPTRGRAGQPKMSSYRGKLAALNIFMRRG